MRTRQRYLAIRVHASQEPPSESAFRNAIWQQLQALYGELGVSRIGFWLTSYHPELKYTIIRCEHTQVRPLRAALATILEIDGVPLILQVMGISGTIRKAVSHLPGLEVQNVVRPRKHR
ncbi:MAG: Rpp14/Pop5 family protein [Candidatus Thorarchaeota archaeon]